MVMFVQAQQAQALQAEKQQVLMQHKQQMEQQVSDPAHGFRAQNRAIVGTKFIDATRSKMSGSGKRRPS
jgi:hypothetical protein